MLTSWFNPLSGQSQQLVNQHALRHSVSNVLCYPTALYAPIWCVYVTAFPIALGIAIIPGMLAQPGVTTMYGKKK